MYDLIIYIIQVGCQLLPIFIVLRFLFDFIRSILFKN